MFRAFAVAVLMMGIGIAAHAGAVISVDQAEFDVGTILEGSTSSVMHDFTIRNTGDADLVIKDVRPG